MTIARDSFDVRLALPGDAPTLSALAVRAKGSWGYPAAWLAEWRDDLTISAEYLSRHTAFVADDKGMAIGMCAIEISSGRASLEHLWIDPGRQKSGLGRALVGEALSHAARMGVARVEVLSDPFAEQFYLRLGARRLDAVPAPMPGAPDRVLPRLEFVL